MVFELVQTAADWLVYTVLGLSPPSQAGSALHFFIYDTVKIFILLLVIIFVITFLRSFFTPEKTRAWLAERKGSTFVGNVLAALLGVDISAHQSKDLGQFIGKEMEMVVTVCDAAQGICPMFPWAKETIHACFPDPAAVTGTPEEQMAAFRASRKEIAAWIDATFGKE